MYSKFFGLNEKPFSITPDPRYLFMSERHSEGLAHLVYGVKDSSGFIQLTGEVGTGKTTLVRTLLARIPSGVEVAMVLNPQLTAVEFLTAICEELKITLPEDRYSSKALVDSLNQHLLASHADGQRTILIIDEAQNLATEVLEQIRLLTNLETAKQKLLQIILIAQPELREKLSQTNLRQLAQRVTGRYHLEPLSKEEASRYIDHRLKVAGGLGEIFSEAAKREVFRFSGGVPRLINVICDRALLGAFSQEVRKISPQIVRTAAQEVSGEKSGALFGRWLLPTVGLLTAAVIVTGLWAATRDSQPAPARSTTLPLSEPAAATADSAGISQAAMAEPASASLSRILQNSRAATTTTSAMKTLLSIWGLTYDPDNGPPCTQAEAAGLHCFFQKGSWSVLQKLDRPVVLTLTDAAGQPHQSVLVAVDDDSAVLQIGDNRIAFPVEELSRLWYGQYLLIWQPPDGNPAVLQRGSQGPKVRWLRQALAALNPGGEAGAIGSDVFDDELEQQLVEFQTRNRLEPDGLAGRQTQIIINSQLGLDGTPSLSGT